MAKTIHNLCFFCRQPPDRASLQGAVRGRLRSRGALPGSVGLFTVKNRPQEARAEKQRRNTRDQKYLYLAGLLNGVATEFADLVRFEQANGFPVIARALWDRDFEQRVHLSAALIMVTARQWTRWSTPRKLASNDFPLAYLCEYVKCATRRPQHKQIALLLDAAWIAHGKLKNWNADMLQAKLRRIPASMKKLATDAALKNAKNQRQNHRKK
jgi:hypothetical protein